MTAMETATKQAGSATHPIDFRFIADSPYEPALTGGAPSPLGAQFANVSGKTESREIAPAMIQPLCAAERAI
jgi:hypothetical protein